MNMLDPTTNPPVANNQQEPNAPLRVGIILDSLTQPQWIYRVIEALNASTVADIALILKNDSVIGPTSNLILSFRFRHVLALAYLALDRRLFRAQLTASFPYDVSVLIETMPIVHLNLTISTDGESLDEEQIAQIQRYHLDVILHFGTHPVSRQILNCCRYGIWKYHQGDVQTKRGGPPGMWEIIEGDFATGSSLHILSEHTEKGQVIYQSFARTIPFSVALNVNNICWNSVNFVQNKLRDLYALHSEDIAGLSEQTEFALYYKRLYTLPTNMQMLRMLSKLGRKTIAEKFRKAISYKQWYLAYQIGDIRSHAPPTLYDFQCVMPPNECFWADPFPVNHEGHYYVFFEEYVYAKRKAHLSVIEVDQQGICQPPTVVLDKPYHLSYPFIFQWNGNYYMIPESSDDMTIQLYRCISFPFEWELEKVLMSNVKAVDTTLVQIEDLWWMFTCFESDEVRFSGDLHLFYASSPLGPWTAHPRNPVKSDVRNSRPGGYFFRWNGQLHRPSQDGSKRYGYGISINRIDSLDMNGLCEITVSKILPEWTVNLSGVHTMNMIEDFIAVDALRDKNKYF